MKRKTMKNDILLALVLLLLAGGLWLVLRLTARQGGEAVVTLNGEVYAVLPLGEDTVLPVVSADGHSNTVVVEDGQVRMQAADCPDQVCVRQGRISRDGESIVCLPHKLTVTVRSAGAGGYDATVG